MGKVQEPGEWQGGPSSVDRESKLSNSSSIRAKRSSSRLGMRLMRNLMSMLRPILRRLVMLSMLHLMLNLDSGKMVRIKLESTRMIFLDRDNELTLKSSKRLGRGRGREKEKKKREKKGSNNKMLIMLL
jgi:hypothetical protein